MQTNFIQPRGNTSVDISREIYSQMLNIPASSVGELAKGIDLTNFSFGVATDGKEIFNITGVTGIVKNVTISGTTANITTDKGNFSVQAIPSQLTIPVIGSVAELRLKRPLFEGQIIYLSGYNSGSTSGKGYFTGSLVNKTDDGGLTFSGGSWSWSRVLDNPAVLKLSDFGAPSNFSTDVSDTLIAVLNIAKTIKSNSTAKRIKILLPPKVQTSKTITIDPTIVSIGSEGAMTEWHIDSNGTYTNNFSFLVTTDLTGASDEAYVNTAIWVFSHILFIEYSSAGIGNKVNFLKLYSTLNGASGVAEAVSQTGLYKIRTRGFKDVFTNGDNGWGWTFDNCGFDDFDRLGNLSGGVNNSERITFLNCIAQNGNTGFNIQNWTGELFWTGGQLDYIKLGEFINNGGCIVVRDCHIETDGRTQPVAKSTTFTGGTNGIATFKDCTFVNLRQNNVAVSLFTNDRKHRTTVMGCRFTTDELSGQYNNFLLCDSVGIIQKNNHFFGAISTVGPMFSQGLINAPKLNMVGYTTTGTGVVVTKSGSKLVITSTAAAGGAKTLTLKLPIVDNWNSGFLGAMAVFSAGTVASGNITATFYAGTIDAGQIDIIGAALTFSNSPGTVKPANNVTLNNQGYNSVFLVLDLLNLGTTDSLTLDAAGGILY